MFLNRRLMVLLALFAIGAGPALASTGQTRKQRGKENRPPTVSKIVIVEELRPGKQFTVQITAGDDQALASLEVRFLDKTRTVEASGRTEEVFLVGFVAPATGEQELSVVALDKHGAKSEAKTITISVDDGS